MILTATQLPRKVKQSSVAVRGMKISKIIISIAKATGILVGVVLLLFLLLLDDMYRPFTITNSDDPRFDPKTFSFKNYSHFKGNEGEFNKAIAKMFPPGTDR